MGTFEGKDKRETLLSDEASMKIDRRISEGTLTRRRRSSLIAIHRADNDGSLRNQRCITKSHLSRARAAPFEKQNSGAEIRDTSNQSHSRRECVRRSLIGTGFYRIGEEGHRRDRGSLTNTIRRISRR